VDRGLDIGTDEVRREEPLRRRLALVCGGIISWSPRHFREVPRAAAQPSIL